MAWVDMLGRFERRCGGGCTDVARLGDAGEPGGFQRRIPGERTEPEGRLLVQDATGKNKPPAPERAISDCGIVNK